MAEGYVVKAVPFVPDMAKLAARVHLAPEQRPELEKMVEQAGAVGVRFLPNGYIAPHRVPHDLSQLQREILHVLSGNGLVLHQEQRVDAVFGVGLGEGALDSVDCGCRWHHNFTAFVAMKVLM